jgi:hypothetical protein
MSSPNFSNAKKRAGVAALALAMGLIAGCASTPVPDDEISVSKHAVESAVSAGGSEFAPIELKTAQDKLTAAEKAVEDDDNLKALHLAQAAEVDAKLAEHKALAAKAEKSLKEAREGQRVLQEEIQRQ